MGWQTSNDGGGWTRRGVLRLLVAVLGGVVFFPHAADAEPKKIEVKSSVLTTVKYDENAKTLDVEFHSGAVYRYADVPAETFQNLLSAKSKGRYFGAHIRKCFAAERLP